MTNSHMQGGKFHPHNNGSDSGVSSDQVKDCESSCAELNQSDVEKLKKRD